jgi:hypothetical protein
VKPGAFDNIDSNHAQQRLIFDDKYDSDHYADAQPGRSEPNVRM